MKPMQERVEHLFHQKILYYRELLEILQDEKQSLLKTQMERLWELAEKKQALVVKIEANRASILLELEQAGITHAMDVHTFKLASLFVLLPQALSARLQNSQVTLVALKDQVQNLTRANKRFVEECLDVLDDLIAVIADTGESEAVYDNTRQSAPASSKQNVLLHREV